MLHGKLYPVQVHVLTIFLSLLSTKTALMSNYNSASLHGCGCAEDVLRSSRCATSRRTSCSQPELVQLEVQHHNCVRIIINLPIRTDICPCLFREHTYVYPPDERQKKISIRFRFLKYSRIAFRYFWGLLRMLQSSGTDVYPRPGCFFQGLRSNE